MRSVNGAGTCPPCFIQRSGTSEATRLASKTKINLRGIASETEKREEQKQPIPFGLAVRTKLAATSSHRFIHFRIRDWHFTLIDRGRRRQQQPARAKRHHVSFRQTQRGPWRKQQFFRDFVAGPRALISHGQTQRLCRNLHGNLYRFCHCQRI